MKVALSDLPHGPLYSSGTHCRFSGGVAIGWPVRGSITLGYGSPTEFVVSRLDKPLWFDKSGPLKDDPSINCNSFSADCPARIASGRGGRAATPLLSATAEE